MKRTSALLVALLVSVAAYAENSYRIPGRIIQSVPDHVEMQQRCYIPQQQGYQQPRQQQHSHVGQIVGGVAGGAIGTRFGQGNGKVLSTIAGAVGGAVVGDMIDNGGNQVQQQPVQQQVCDSVPVRVQTYSVTAQDNTGQVTHTFTSTYNFQPGTTLYMRVWDSGRIDLE